MLAGQKARLEPQSANLSEEFRPVRSIARSSGRDCFDIFDTEVLKQKRKSPETTHGQRDGILSEPAGSCNFPAKLSGDFLVQQHHRRAHRAAVDHHAHCV